MTVQSQSTDTSLVPELGPALGRLCDPPEIGLPPGVLGIGFEDIRLQLVTALFDVAGAARSFAAAGDRQGAIASLARVVWIDLWERAVASAARRITDVVNTRLREGAQESHLSERGLNNFLLKVEDERAIASRLGSGGANFVAALDAMEQTVPVAAAPGPRGRQGVEEWQVALVAAARRLESAWLALLDSAVIEQQRWLHEIRRVRDWRRPRWPLWAATGVLLGLATYVGLVLGGYLRVPTLLRGLANYWWSHL
jgi:hypothetical protein